MKRLLFIVCLFSVTLFARNDAIGNPKFLDIEVNDNTAQSEIDRLKEEFLSRSKEIHTGYEKRIDKLHAQRKDDMGNLKKEFKRKLKGLKKRHSHVQFPDKPHKIKKPKDNPEHKTKPMLKEDADKRRDLKNPNKKNKREDKKALKVGEKKVQETKK